MRSQAGKPCGVAASANRFGTGRHRRQAEYSPLQVGCSYRRDDHKDEQQESEALDFHETRSTEEGTAVGCPSRGAGGRTSRRTSSVGVFASVLDNAPASAGPRGRTSITPSSGSAAVDMNSSEQETLQRAAAWSCPLGEHDGQEHQGIFDPAQGMGIVAQQVEPVAGRQVVGFATDGEGGPPLEAMNRDRTLNLVVVADLAPLGSTSRMAANVSFFTSAVVLASESDSWAGRRSTGMPEYACGIAIGFLS